MAGKTVLILGGGIGGLTAARALARRLKEGHRVVLVEPNPVQQLGASLIWVAAGRRGPEQVSRDIRRFLPKRVELIQSSVSEIDLDRGTARADGQEMGYDYLVVALGARLAPEAVPGLAEGAHTFYEVNGAIRLEMSLSQFDMGSLALVIPSLPIKCPAAPYEFILTVDYYFRRRGVRDRVELQVYTVEPMPLPIAGPVACETLLALLKGRDISFHPGHRLSAVDPEGRQLTFEGGSPAGYDLLVTVPPHRCPEVVSQAGLVGEAGWIPVDRGSLKTRAENVYAVGDVNVIPLGEGRALPKAGVFARGEAQVVARNLAAEINGSGERVSYMGKGACFLETGYGKGTMVAGDFFAQPQPKVGLRRQSRLWHWAKLLFEERWRLGWF